jgi:hypothetical protein
MTDSIGIKNASAHVNKYCVICSYRYCKSEKIIRKQSPKNLYPVIPLMYEIAMIKAIIKNLVPDEN